MNDLEARFRKIKKLVKEEEAVQDQLRGQIEDLSERLRVSIQTAVEIRRILESPFLTRQDKYLILLLVNKIIQQA